MNATCASAEAPRCALFAEVGAQITNADNGCSRLWSLGRSHYLVLQANGYLVCNRVVNATRVMPVWTARSNLTNASRLALVLRSGGDWVLMGAGSGAAYATTRWCWTATSSRSWTCGYPVMVPFSNVITLP
ncbi:hypothetical protein HYH03_013582 [Edaphochlamys debaryana]|uniref:Uncharacterized protein n=1 Tax=Edaphochlamys debaryana TaxID=47281 RepID=A0A836BUG0_9CHLO|nr:hypothetical protein HYH03_013582 [Edaphochlamys debaryana]|eukprot:KAG2487869.1 hypothetical protein HYH03_013582 [Edaphochlamys debaryana]